MNERETNEATDDTEGNMPLRKTIEDGVEDDTEGQKQKVRFVDDGIDTDDTEGNAYRSGVSDGVEDDTDGQGFRMGVSDGAKDDDTEAQGRRIQRLDTSHT